MLLAYIDESGNRGQHSKGGATPYYSLGCVLVDADHWSASFDQLVDFRRRLRDTYKLPVRAEVKANYLIRASGAFRALGLSPSQRGLIYRAHMKMLEGIGARAFSIVVEKEPNNRQGDDLLEFAWVSLLQRLERTTHYDKTRLMIVHDEGDDLAVRKQVRKARRFLTAGSMAGGSTLRVDAKDIVDDPVPRSSAESYFIQMADLVAYAGWRTVVAPGPSVAPVVDGAWSALGAGVHSAVNRFSGGSPGVVVRK